MRGGIVLEDKEIVSLYLTRNESAIAQTSEKYGARLKGIANRILRDEQTAEECVNDAYLEVWNLIPPHKPENYLFAFVGKIVRNIALNECKKQQRQKRSAVYCELTREMQECIPSSESTEEQLEAAELSGVINSFLKTCSDEQQNVFVRRYWYFDPISKIAKDFGFSQSKVKTMLFRIRTELKKNLEKGGYSI